MLKEVRVEKIDFMVTDIKQINSDFFLIICKTNARFILLQLLWISQNEIEVVQQSFCSEKIRFFKFFQKLQIHKNHKKSISDHYPKLECTFFGIGLDLTYYAIKFTITKKVSFSILGMNNWLREPFDHLFDNVLYDFHCVLTPQRRDLVICFKTKEYLKISLNKLKTAKIKNDRVVSFIYQDHCMVGISKRKKFWTFVQFSNFTIFLV